jgi:hypothetical protein
VDVVAVEMGAVVTARAVSAVGAGVVLDVPMLAALAWTPRGDPSALLDAARCVGDEDRWRRGAWWG